jgi:hypothetical protein
MKKYHIDLSESEAELLQRLGFVKGAQRGAATKAELLK